MREVIPFSQIHSHTLPPITYSWLVSSGDYWRLLEITRENYSRNFSATHKKDGTTVRERRKAQTG